MIENHQKIIPYKKLDNISIRQHLDKFSKRQIV
jgi:hypothetical protein